MVFVFPMRRIRLGRKAVNGRDSALIMLFLVLMDGQHDNGVYHNEKQKKDV